MEKLQLSPARRVAYAGVITALSVALLYLLQVLPTMRAAMLFVLSLLPVVLAYEKRYADAALGYVAATLLSALLVPVSGQWLMYVAFFGWYGIVREFVVTRWNRAVTWAVMAILFNVAFFVLYFFFSSLLLYGYQPPAWLQSVPLPLVLIPVAEIALVVFELLFGLCRTYYIDHIRKLLVRR